MLKQEKVWRLLFTKEDKNKCRTLIKTFFANMDLLHKPIFKKILVEWDDKLVALANIPIFFTIDILEKYNIEVKDYVNDINRFLLMFFKRELSNLLKNLTDPIDPIERKLRWILKTAASVNQIIIALFKVNRRLNGKPPHLEEVISYLEHSIKIVNEANEIKHKTSIKNKQLFYYALNHILDTL